MAKGKRGPALFDLLDLEGDEKAERLKVPGWWSGERESPPAEPESAIRLDHGNGSRSSRPAPTAALGEGVEKAPLLDMDGGSIRVTLSSVGAAAAVFALLAVMLVAFQGGRKVGYRHGADEGYQRGRQAYLQETMGEIDLAQQMAPATELVAPLLNEMPARASNQAGEKPETEVRLADSAAAPWVIDHTYVVVQEFRGDRAEDMERAREFLARKGIETAPVVLDSGWIQLLTAKGFNRADETQRRLSDELLEKIRSLGQEYYTTGGGYKLEGYFKTLKSETW